GLGGTQPRRATLARRAPGVPGLGRPVASRQAGLRGGLPEPPPRGRRGLQRPREARWRSRLSLVHAPDGRLLPPVAGALVSRRPRAGAARDAPVPAGGGAHQAERAHRAPDGLRGGGRLRRELVLVRGLGVPAAPGARPSLRLPRSAAGSAVHLARLPAY